MHKRKMCCKRQKAGGNEASCDVEIYVHLLNSHTVRDRFLDEYPSKPYTDVYWIKYADINSARAAKRKLDNKSFFGKELHIFYVPEYETVQETREKLQQRRIVIAKKTRGMILSLLVELSSLLFDSNNYFLLTTEL